MTDLLVQSAMFLLMFGMGLTLTEEDFRRIARAPAPTIVGTAIQLVLMPILGIAIARAFDLPPLLAVGIVVLAALPGGMFSNIYVHLSKGNTALSVTLTATATLVTLFTLPLWIRVALSTEAGAAASASLDMPILRTALQLGMLTVVPVAFGMIVRHHKPESADWERRLSIPCFIAICIGVAIQGADRPEPPTAEFMACLAPVAVYTVCGLLTGIVVPLFFRIDARDTVTITVELVVKNTLLGIVLLTNALDFEAVVPLLVFILFQTPAAIALLVGWRMLARAGWIEAPTRRTGTAIRNGEESALQSLP